MTYPQGLDQPLPLLRSVISEGRRFAYRETGEGSGVPVVFLHGLGSSSAGWRAVLAALPKDRRLIAWDAPGFGGSDPLPADAPPGSGHIVAALALLDGLGITTAHIVGSSWGASLAVSIARAAPARVQSLTLLGPNTCMGALPAEDRAAARAQLLHPDFIVAAAKASFLSMLIADDSHPVVAERAFALRDSMSALGFTQAVDMMLATDTLDDARSVRVPATIAVGTQDRIAPRDIHALPIAQALSGATVIDIEGCGHLSKLEYPDAVVTAVLDRLAAAEGFR